MRRKHQVICFFYCCVAQIFWKNIAEICDRALGADFESLAKLCLNDKKKLRAVNVCTTAAL
jgi:hypothetical protein